MGGNLNIINQWREPQKRGNQIFKVQWGEAKWLENTIFYLNLVWGEGTLEETSLFFLISNMALGPLDQLQIFWQLYLIELLGF